MRIILVGAGVVGYHLAERLSVEGHDISVIDASHDLVRRIDEKLNVLAVEGDASTPSVLRRAGAEGADLVIAVTDRDNTNLVVSLIARKMGARKVGIDCGPVRPPLRALTGDETDDLLRDLAAMEILSDAHSRVHQ